MQDKSKLGTRYTCFECGTKFYDLNRPVPTCPECDANQQDAPVRDIKALLSSGGKAKRAASDAAAAATTESNEEEDEFEEINLEEDDEESDDELGADDLLG